MSDLELAQTKADRAMAQAAASAMAAYQAPRLADGTSPSSVYHAALAVARARHPLLMADISGIHGAVDESASLTVPVCMPSTSIWVHPEPGYGQPPAADILPLLAEITRLKAELAAAAVAAAPAETTRTFPARALGSQHQRIGLFVP